MMLIIHRVADDEMNDEGFVGDSLMTATGYMRV